MRALVLFIIIPLTLFAHDKKSEALLQDIKVYLSGIKSYHAKFVQTSEEETSYGNIYIKKPNMSIIYSGNQNIKIVVRNDNLIYYDIDLDEISKTSIDENPLLGILARSDYDFEKSFTNVSASMEDNFVVLKLNDADGNEFSMHFFKNPMLLHRVGYASADSHIDMCFYNIQTNIKIPSEVFWIKRDLLNRK